jgi:RNA polymerase sigma-70 factor (ECF subfamily)
MDPERQAIEECKCGKSESYQYIVDKYKTRAYHAALLYTGNSDDALDLSQEAFCKAYQAIKSFDLGRNFYTWFYQILKNICINYYRRKKQRTVSFSQTEAATGIPVEIPISETPEEIFERNEMRDLLWKALGKLKDTDREIILLKEFQELSYKDIADAMQLPMGSVMSRLFYARQRLSKILERML